MTNYSKNVTPIEAAPSYCQSLAMRFRQSYEKIPARTRGGLRVLGIAAVAVVVAELGANLVGGPQGNDDPSRYADSQLTHVSGLVLGDPDNETSLATVRFDPAVDDDILSNRAATLKVSPSLEIPTTHVYRTGVDTEDNTAIWYGVPKADLENALPADELKELSPILDQDADSILWVNAQRAKPNFDN